MCHVTQRVKLSSRSKADSYLGDKDFIMSDNHDNIYSYYNNYYYYLVLGHYQESLSA